MAEPPADRDHEPFRSPLLMNREDSALLVIDVQEKLVPHIHDHAVVTWNIRRLLDGAKILEVFRRTTEQYPEGLGATIPGLREQAEILPSKLMFSCRGCGELGPLLFERGISKVLLAGIETHVCVAQTALDLIAAGFAVYLAVDATGSRFPTDRDVALRRLESGGVTLTTTEAALFEWCEVAGTPEFKAISRLVREPAPVD